MAYNYSDAHSIGVTEGPLPIPQIPDVYSDRMFSVSIRNIGSFDAVVTFLNRINSRIPIQVPSTNNGIVLDNVPWETIAGGALGSADGATSVWITILEQVQVAPILPQLAIPVGGDPLLTGKLPEGDLRDQFVVTF